MHWGISINGVYGARIEKGLGFRVLGVGPHKVYLGCFGAHYITIT